MASYADPQRNQRLAHTFYSLIIKMSRRKKKTNKMIAAAVRRRQRCQTCSLIYYYVWRNKRLCIVRFQKEEGGPYPNSISSSYGAPGGAASAPSAPGDSYGAPAAPAPPSNSYGTPSGATATGPASIF